MFVASTTHRRAPHARRAARQAVASGVVCAHRASRCTLTKTNCHSKTTSRFHHRNQQYSVIALTNGSGAIAERYAYSAYGEPVFVSATGTVLAESAKDNRYTYTGREWDEELSLYHFRARMYDAKSGRFASIDPSGYLGSQWNLTEFLYGAVLTLVDPSGLAPPISTRPTARPPGPTFPAPTPNVTPGRLPPGISPRGPIPFPKPKVPLTPGVGGRVCGFFAKRICVPVLVVSTGVDAYQCGSYVAEYTTVPMCETVVRWWCDDDTEVWKPSPQPMDPNTGDDEEPYDHCRSEYEKCLGTVMSTWTGRQRNRCYTCFQKCKATGIWRSWMTRTYCAYWETDKL
jgi:RHS repeat-associated protein